MTVFMTYIVTAGFWLVGIVPVLLRYYTAILLLLCSSEVLYFELLGTHSWGETRQTGEAARRQNLS